MGRGAGADQNRKQDEEAANSILLYWRVLVMVLLLLVFIFVAVSMHTSGSAKGPAGVVHCPLLPPAEQLISHGVSAGEGEPCMFRDNGTWPLCRNMVLPGDREEHQLRCVRRVCSKRLGAGGECSIDGHPHDDWCESGVCAYSDAAQKWTCRGEHFAREGEHCQTSAFCNRNLQCSSGKCVPRLTEGAVCTHEDGSPSSSPSRLGEQCAQGLWCARAQGNSTLQCIKLQWGTEGTPCPFTPGQPRPRCLGGRLYCADIQRCIPLEKEDGPCTAVGGRPAEENDAACDYGLGCFVNRSLAPGETANGRCVRLLSISAGEESADGRFCKPSLISESGYCVEHRKRDFPCGSDADCGTGLKCICHGRSSGTSPGTCQPPPLQLPPHEERVPSGFSPACRDEFASLSRFLMHWTKRWAIDDVDGFSSAKTHLETEALCCVRTSGAEGSHLWTLAGGYLTDVKGADLTCRSDLAWLWVVLSVTLFSTIFGVCCLCCSALTPTSLTPSEGATLPYGDQFSPVPQVDEDASRMHRQDSGVPLRDAGAV